MNQIAWVSTSYMMANVVLIPMSGWLQRRFGYRNCFVGALLLFTVGSTLCGLAWNLPALIVFRTLQGIGGGAIIPTAQAVLFLRYPKRQHGMAAALVGLGGITGPLIGPYLGGTVIDLSSWHWIFLINIPIGLLAALLCYRALEEPTFRAKSMPIDRFGIVLLTLGLTSLQYVLEEGQRDDWFASPLILALSMLSCVMLVTFVVHELETEQPIVNLRLFAKRSYSAATGINFLVGVSVFSGSFMFALFCGNILRYSALDIGLTLLKGNLIMLVLMPLMGRVTDLVDGRLLIAVGVVLMAISLQMNGAFTSDVDNAALLRPLLVRAVAVALVFVPLMAFALSDVHPSERGDASALFNLTRELGGSIGTAWMTTILDTHMKAYSVSIGSNVHVYSASANLELAQIAQYLRGSVWDTKLAALAVIKFRIARQALSLAFNDNFILLGYLFAASLLLVLMLKRPPPGTKIEAGH